MLIPSDMSMNEPRSSQSERREGGARCVPVLVVRVIVGKQANSFILQPAGIAKPRLNRAKLQVVKNSEIWKEAGPLNLDI
jgi:hypothetical protein